MSKKTTETNATEKPTSIQVIFADTNISMKSGRLVRAPEEVANGKFVKIRIAGNKQYKTPDGETKSITNYFEALVSSNLKEAFSTAKSLEQGDWVYLKGEDSTQSFDTAEGYKQTATTLFAYQVVLKKKKGEPASEQPQDNPETSIH